VVNVKEGRGSTPLLWFRPVAIMQWARGL